MFPVVRVQQPFYLQMSHRFMLIEHIPYSIGLRHQNKAEIEWRETILRN